jgi:hypothetical protein
MVSVGKGTAVDAMSLELVEFALMVIGQSRERLETTKPSINCDFQTVDLSLIESALPSVEQIGRI